jgi:hypothetical protein
MEHDADHCHTFDLIVLSEISYIFDVCGLPKASTTPIQRNATGYRKKILVDGSSVRRDASDHAPARMVG